MDWFVLRFTLADSDPAVSRTVAVPYDTSFFDLHHIIQKAMDWDDVHIHEFVTEDFTHIGPFFVNDELFDELDMGISMYEGQKILYIYDFSICRKINISWEGRTTEHSSLCPELLSYENDSPEDNSKVLEELCRKYKLQKMWPDPVKRENPRNEDSARKRVGDYIVTGEMDGRTLVPPEAFSLCCISLFSVHGDEIYFDKERMMLCEKAKKKDEKCLIPKVQAKRIDKFPARYVPVSIPYAELSDILQKVLKEKGLQSKMCGMDIESIITGINPETLTEDERDAVTCATTLVASRIFREVGLCVDYGYDQPSPLEIVFRDYNGDLEKVNEVLAQMQQ